jgi:hypothetical protein
MKKHFLLIIFLILLSNQKVNSQYSFKNKNEVAIYNVLSGALIGGIGALINNNHKDKKIVAFGKGFYKGALSGLVIFSGKDLVSKFQETNNYVYLSGSKLLVLTGSSMLENTVENKRLFEKLHYDIGFVRMEFYPYNKFKVKSRIMPYSLSTTIWLFSKYKLSVKNTLYTGNFIFYNEKDRRTRNNRIILGAAFGNNILFAANTTIYSKELIITHEMIHVFQTNSFSFSNSFFYKLESRWLGNYKFYKWYQRYFYTDYENLTARILYYISAYFYNHENNNYRENIFESEAFFMMNR